jgi:hypothetical protein
MKCSRLFPIVLGSFVLTGPLQGQEASEAKDSPLVQQAEKTKRERAVRRSGAQNPAKAFDNDSLKHPGKQADTPPAPAGGSAAATDASVKDGRGDGKTPEKTDEQLRAEHRDAIQKKIEDQVKLMDIVREAMDDAQAELNDLTNYTMGSRRGALLKRLEDGKAEIAKAEQTIADLQEEARREGISVSRP